MATISRSNALELISTAGDRITLIGNSDGTDVPSGHGLGDYSGNTIATQYSNVLRPVDSVAKTLGTALTVTEVAGARAVSYGNFDFGSARFLLGNASGVSSLNASAVAQPTEAFAAASAMDMVGIGTYGGVIWSADANGKVYFHDGPKFNPADPPVFGYVWRDNKSTGTGYHETALSPLSATTAVKNRARIAISTAAFSVGAGVDDVDSVRIYGGTVSGAKYHQALGSTTSYTLTTLATSGTVPGSVAAFPVGASAQIKSSDGALVISADGSVKAETLNLTGTASVGGNLGVTGYIWSGGSISGASMESTAMPTNGGVPLVQSGTFTFSGVTGLSGTATGQWTKWADGTMIITLRHAWNITSAGVTSFWWTFPIAFIAAPAIAVTADTTVIGSSVGGASYDTPSTTKASININRSNTTNTNGSVIAIGRWK